MKVTAKYGFGYTDYRNLLAPGLVELHEREYTVPANVLSCRCLYCRSEHQAAHCPNCGAPK